MSSVKPSVAPRCLPSSSLKLAVAPSTRVKPSVAPDLDLVLGKEVENKDNLFWKWPHLQTWSELVRLEPQCEEVEHKDNLFLEMASFTDMVRAGSIGVTVRGS